MANATRDRIRHVYDRLFTPDRNADQPVRKGLASGIAKHEFDRLRTNRIEEIFDYEQMKWVAVTYDDF